MKERFVISDTHFGHKNIVNFTNNDGSPLRPWDDIDEHDAALVKNWNDTVGPKDTVYHLGDVVINRRFLPMMQEMNGRKILIKGNHDIFKLKDYLPHFEDIRAYKVMPGEKLIMSHIPIHPDNMARFPVNVHGHLHGNHMMDQIMSHQRDPSYINVCVEWTDYTPLSYDVLLERVKDATS